MKYAVSFLVTFCLLATAAFSQGLGLSTSIIGPDTVQQNDQEQISVFLSNDSIVPLSGTIDLKIAVDSAAQLVVNQPVSIQIQPGDTQMVNVTVDFTMVNGFEPGGNIVLIWPEMPSGPAGDTLSHSIHVIAAPTGSGLDSLGCDAGSQMPPPVLHNNFDLTWSIVNRDSDTLTKAFQVMVGVHDGSTVQTVQTVSNQNINALPPGESNPGFIFNFDVSLVQALVDGGSVIVVWPEAPINATDTFITVDSLWLDVEVAPVGFEEPTDPYLQSVKVFPNPSTGMVYVRYLGGNEPIERVSITDANGRLVASYGYIDAIDFTEFPSGFYFVEVEVDNGATRTFKLLRP